MKRKVLVFVIFVVLIFAQLVVLYSFFHPVQTEGFAYNSSLVEIGKMIYVSGDVSITVSAPIAVAQLSNGTQVNLKTTIQFPNGTQVIVNSTYTFQIKLPRTGDCLCNGGAGLYGEISSNGQTIPSIDQSNPIVAAVIANQSSSVIDGMPKSGSTVNGLFQYYWFVVQGDASVSISGYSVAY
jgi:hypothetical protein